MVDYRTAWLAVCWGVLAAQSVGRAPDRPVGGTERASLRYTISASSPESQRVVVDVSLTGLDPRETTLRWEMQQRFAFVRLPEPLIEEPVRATAGGRPVSLRRAGPYEWEAALDGQREMTLSYAVPLTHRALEAVRNRDAYEYPYLAADHGLLVTAALLLYPTTAPPLDLRVQFELPAGWRIITPWRPVGQREFDPGGPESLLNDLVAVGSWHTHEIRVGDFVGTIAFAPGQEPLEAAAVDPIRRIVDYELKLFGRPAQGRYLFVFGRPDTSGMAGSPKTHSMTLSVEPRLAPHAGRYLPHLIAHEFYHTWSAALFEMPDELRWVGEGFTDYYAYLVSARLGLTSWKEFAETLGDKMRGSADNPQRGKLSLCAAGGEVFFRDRDAYNLVYDGGLLIAAWLDRAIRLQGRGQTLDALMRAFHNDPRWTKDEVTPSVKDFLAAAERFTDTATVAKLERLVRRPYRLEPLEAFAELGVTIRREEAPPDLDLRANLDGTRVIDIDPASVTHRVGVRANDRLVEINGRPVGDAREVRLAWREPVDDRIRVTVERDGRRLVLDEPVPRIERFIVPVEPWREHE
jgi:predicted metalloprotease with PDZ domain